MARQKNRRAARPSVIQICIEGKTEALYIRALCRALGLDGRVQLCPCPAGCGRKHEALVQQAQQCMRSSNAAEVWVVYDMDEAAVDDRAYESFCAAFQLGKEAGYHVVVSAPCFEYWLLLHLQSCEADWTWPECEKRFKEKVNRLREQGGLAPYCKEEHKCDPALFDLLGGVEGAKKAAGHARRLAETRGYQLRDLQGLPPDRARRLFNDKCRPCTSMPLLLDRLFRLAQT